MLQKESEPQTTSCDFLKSQHRYEIFNPLVPEIFSVHIQPAGDYRDLLHALCEAIALPENITFYNDSGLEKYGSRHNTEDGRTFIEINQAFPFREQLLTLTHEVVHSYPPFAFRSDEKVEEDITAFSRHILRRRPDIRIFLQERLRKAYELQRDRLF